MTCALCGTDAHCSKCGIGMAFPESIAAGECDFCRQGFTYAAKQDHAATLGIQGETVACPYCEGTGRRLGSMLPCNDPKGCKGSGRLPPLGIQGGAKQ